MNRATLSGAIVFGLLAGAFATGGVKAADYPLKAVPAASWAGFYIGGALGKRWADIEGTSTFSVQNFIGPVVQNNIAACPIFPPCTTQKNYDGSTWKGGPFAGYNFMIAPRWVAGIEGDFNWGSKTTQTVGHSYPISFGGANPRNSFAVKTTWDASLRGRAGLLITPTILLYGTGGVAWLHVEATSTCGTTLADSCQPGGISPAVNTNSKTVTGWTLGAGAEAQLMANWLVRLDYRYARYGTFSATDTRPCTPTPSAICGTATSFVDSYDIKVRTHSVMAGIAYRFGQ